MPIILTEEDVDALDNPPAGTVALAVDDSTHEFATKKPDGSIDSLIGPAGPTGPAGADGADGADGANGADGADGANGADGADGADGVGVPVGGTTAQYLAKASNADFDTLWTSLPSTVSQAEAEAGTATTTRFWTAQRVAQAIAALAAGGTSDLDTILAASSAQDIAAALLAATAPDAGNPFATLADVGGGGGGSGVGDKLYLYATQR